MKEQSKLSKLQKQILVLALENKLRENRDFEERNGADIYYSEILATVYGFPPEVPLRQAGERTQWGKFDREVIGRARYNAAHAAISRTMSHLQARGLIRWVCARYTRWSGCNLTPAGFEIAKRVKTRANLP